MEQWKLAEDFFFTWALHYEASSAYFWYLFISEFIYPNIKNHDKQPQEAADQLTKVTQGFSIAHSPERFDVGTTIKIKSLDKYTGTRAGDFAKEDKIMRKVWGKI